MIDWLLSIYLCSAFTFLISIGLCFCLKRDRGTYSTSSSGRVVAFDNNNVISSIHNGFTIVHDSIDGDLQTKLYSNESDGYEKIIGSADGEIQTVPSTVHRDSTSSTEYGYTKLTIISVQAKPTIEETPLYATVDKAISRTKSPVLISISSNTTNNTAAAAAAALSKGCSPASLTQMLRSSPHDNSSSQLLTGSTIDQYQQTQPPPPPLNHPPPIPLSFDQLYAHNSNGSLGKPYYDELITRESLQYRQQRLEQLPSLENYYSSVHSEGTGPTSELYAEISNSSGLGTVPTQYHDQNRTTMNRQPNYYSDDQSERYATVIETDQRPISLLDPTRIYHELDPATATTTQDLTTVSMKL
ncbi:unnamed protein product [Didymodactylos carnosus]|uniref:Uncharacterized protein n=1 Tax=Didymodactylos carnosus TaxID=1234261 RepID=A0A814G6R5_9BILA|nr:unnamed protein product [Didymodactylos carnosus]CAF3766406.1 unnamed protein product [Didymodactylos carnosus]